nr:zinc finger matrin-type protein 4 isoform X4 [Odocoileus virginianus texanus]
MFSLKSISRVGIVSLMKSSDIDQDLFTDSYCKVCSAQLISESQRVAHYESRKHASKVRLYYMLHPRDGGCPAKRLRSENGNDADMVDKNKCCTLCNMSFTSAVVADSHYQGKIHAKRLKLLLGENTPLKTTATPLSSLKPPRVDTAPVVPPPYQRRDSDRYCGLCAAWFNNPLMAQQHYDGKKHKKNAARVALLEQLGTTLDMGELRGLRRNYRCTTCSVSLNSIEQYHAHLKGSKHQTK